MHASRGRSWGWAMGIGVVVFGIVGGIDQVELVRLGALVGVVLACGGSCGSGLVLRCVVRARARSGRIES